MGPQDPSDGLPTSATTPIPPRVLPGRKRPESGAFSVKSVMVAATASALRTRTVSFASTSSNMLSFPVSSKSSSSLRQPSVKSKLGSMSISATPSNFTLITRRPVVAAGSMGGIPLLCSSARLPPLVSSRTTLHPPHRA
jgi:hypothetical protein